MLSSLFWSVGDIFGTKATRKIGGYSTALWSSLFGFFLLSLYAPTRLGDLTNADTSTIVLCLVLGALGMIPFLAIYEALRLGNASVVYTIGAASGGLIVILSMIFLGQTVGFDQGISILLIILGILIASVNRKSLKGSTLLKDKGLKWALLAMVLWGVYYTFITIPVAKVGWFWPNYFTLLMFPIIFLLMKYKKIPVENPVKKKVLVPLLFSSVLINLGAFSYNAALTKGLTIIVAPISATYPVLFSVLAFLIFKDKMTRQQIIGTIVMLIGIILLSFFSST